MLDFLHLKDLHLLSAKHNNSKDLQIRAIRIRVLRTIFALGIILSILAFVSAFIVTFFSKKTKPIDELIKGNNLVIQKPTFIGHTNKGGKVTVTADDAQRALGGIDETVYLKRPKMRTEMGSEVIAASGIWKQATQELILHDNVEFTYANGDKAYAQDAYYGRLPSADNKGFVFSDAIVYLNDSVVIKRKTGEIINTNSATWNDVTKQLRMGEISQLQLKDFPSPKENNVIITYGDKGRAVSKNLIINSEEKIAYGSGDTNIVSEKISATADSYEFHSDTKQIILRGNARATFRK